MPFVQRVVEPKHLSRTSLWDEEGKPRVADDELEAVTNNTLSNALRQLASLVLVADDIFNELRRELCSVARRSEHLKTRIGAVEEKVAAYDPKKVAVRKYACVTWFALRTINYLLSRIRGRLYQILPGWEIVGMNGTRRWAWDRL